MQGFLWLLFQISALLAAAAIIFFWLGWVFRGLKTRTQIADFNHRLDTESVLLKDARQEIHTHLQTIESLKGGQVRKTTALEEAIERQQALEREILRLSDLLKSSSTTSTSETESALSKPDS